MEAAHVASEPRVTPLELFFDLVFGFALTQVTAMLAADATWPGLVRGLLVLGALWWAWAAYAWLTNEVSGEDGRARLVVFGAMAAMILVALAVPEAFDEHALLFALAYLVVRFATSASSGSAPTTRASTAPSCASSRRPRSGRCCS